MSNRRTKCCDDPRPRPRTGAPRPRPAVAGIRVDASASTDGRCKWRRPGRPPCFTWPECSLQRQKPSLPNGRYPTPTAAAAPVEPPDR